MFQPDGWGQTRIGVLTPHADIVPETEFNALAPDGISIHAARIPFGGYRPGGSMDPTIANDPVRAIADPPAVDDAAEMLAMAPLHAIVFGFTSSSYVRGAADDAALKSRLETRTRGIPVVITCAAAATALAALSAKRVALISPPWFSTEMAQQGARYFQSRGFEAVYSHRQICHRISKLFSRTSSTTGYVLTCPRVPKQFYRWQWLSRDWRHQGVGGNPRSPGSVCKPSRFLVRAASHRHESACCQLRTYLRA